MYTTDDLEKHYVNRSNWLRAAILGANDGILSTASIIIGVAGIVAGALAMAAGEYVSVSSQADIENADLEREKWELENMPELELSELAKIYKGRGLDDELALEVAKQLTAHDALEAHARDELGINEITQAKPLEAALASGAAFIFGGALPLLVGFLAPLKQMVYSQFIAAMIFLIVLGIVAAKMGGSNPTKAVIRITFWGTIAMGLTAYIGSLFGVSA